MGGNLPPGVTDRMIDEAQPGYYDEPADEDPTELDAAYDENARLRNALRARLNCGVIPDDDGPIENFPAWDIPRATSHRLKRANARDTALILGVIAGLVIAVAVFAYLNGGLR